MTQTLTIINSSKTNNISVCLQDSHIFSCSLGKESKSINPSSYTTIDCNNPTGNLFISVDGEEKWKGLVPTDIVLYYDSENNTISDGTGEIPPLFIPETKNSLVNYRLWLWIIIGIIILFLTAKYFNLI